MMASIVLCKGDMRDLLRVGTRLASSEESPRILARVRGPGARA
jgi:hypothetical protein